jgi:hypothetical protein
MPSAHNMSPLSELPCERLGDHHEDNAASPYRVKGTQTSHSPKKLDTLSFPPKALEGDTQNPPNSRQFSQCEKEHDDVPVTDKYERHDCLPIERSTYNAADSALFHDTIPCEDLF